MLKKENEIKNERKNERKKQTILELAKTKTIQKRKEKVKQKKAGTVYVLNVLN